MRDTFFKKTHYECAWTYLESIHTDTFTQEMLNTGKDPTYEDFATSSLSALSHNGDVASIVNYLNIYFHIYQMRQSGEKIYYVTPDLSARLAQTTINIDTYFLKSPFREIFVQIDSGLFFINDTNETRVPVQGFYVYLRDFNKYKQIRVMATSLLKPTPLIPFNDANFYYHIEISPGKLYNQLQKYIENEVEPKKKSLKRFDLAKNIDHLEEFTAFVFNVLLYITSKNPDLTNYIPTDYNQRLKNLKSASKKRKLKQRAQKSTSHRIIIIGASIQDKNNDMEKIQKAGGIGNWKLKNKIRVSGHWRAQWYGSEKDNTRHAESIWIDDYDKGPEFSETVTSKFIVKGDKK